MSLQTKRIRCTLLTDMYMPGAVYTVPRDIADRMIRTGRAVAFVDESAPLVETKQAPAPVPVEPPAAAPAAAEPEDSLSIEDLREAAKASGIRGYHLMGEERLRKELGL